MNTFKISNISFGFSEHAIDFSFFCRFESNEWATASLQLPDVADCQHSVFGEDYDCDNEAHKATFDQLEKEYFASFKDTDCAAASSLLGELITHVEEVDGLYVAFSRDSKYLIKESPYRSYYNKASLFDLLMDEDHIVVSEEQCLDVKKLIKQAEVTYFEALSRRLSTEMRDYMKAIDPRAFTQDLIEQCFDEILHEFMKDEFDQFDGDYRDDKLAQEFYQNIACDIRGDFENELRELANV